MERWEEACSRFTRSYGSWIGVASMLTQKETLAIQATCSYMYQVGVPRIMSSFRFDFTVHSILIHPAHNGCLIASYNTESQECSWLEVPLDEEFKSDYKSVLVDMDWVGFNFSTKMIEVVRISGLQSA